VQVWLSAGLLVVVPQAAASLQLRLWRLSVQLDHAVQLQTGVQLGTGTVQLWLSAGRPDVLPQALASLQVRD